ncbi:hypothetical protein [Nocardioides sp. Kera G14]|nr:hypothetical protein [Nocardioides sp. Kera G14]UDY24767.1 hypothetical protein LH076_05550 [Nocardioides sp. Kera G14]
MLNAVVLHAAEAAEHSEKVNHWIVGGVAIVILLSLMLILLAFAGGREHS